VTDTALTYVGPLQRGTVGLPTRQVHFTRGETVAFTSAEADLLDTTEWVPADAELVVDREEASGRPSAREVLAEVGDDPDKAAVALAVERGRDNPRKGLIRSLERITPDPTTTDPDPADPATDQEG
jgi:hypothetical protein